MNPIDGICRAGCSVPAGHGPRDRTLGAVVGHIHVGTGIFLVAGPEEGRAARDPRLRVAAVVGVASVVVDRAIADMAPVGIPSPVAPAGVPRVTPIWRIPPVRVPSEPKTGCRHEDHGFPPRIEPAAAIVCATVQERIEPQVFPAMVAGLERKGVGVVQVAPVCVAVDTESESETEGQPASRAPGDSGGGLHQSRPCSVAVPGMMARGEAKTPWHVLVDLRSCGCCPGQHRSDGQYHGWFHHHHPPVPSDHAVVNTHGPCHTVATGQSHATQSITGGGPLSAVRACPLINTLERHGGDACRPTGALLRRLRLTTPSRKPSMDQEQRREQDERRHCQRDLACKGGTHFGSPPGPRHAGSPSRSNPAVRGTALRRIGAAMRPVR